MYVTLGNPQYKRRRGLSGAINTGGLVASGAGVATTATVSSLASGTALGAWAGPIGAGVGAVVGIIAGLWSAHNARVKGAKTENTLVGSAAQTVASGLQAIFQAANAGQITGAQGASLAQQLLQTYWQMVGQARGMPGVADASGGGANCGTPPSFGLNTPSTGNPCTGMIGGHKCDKSCTAGCCVGCQDLTPSIAQAVAVLSSPSGGTMLFCPIASSSFGLAATPSFSLTYKPPPVAQAVAANLSTVGGTLATDLGIAPTSTVGGIPAWMLVLAGAAALAYYAL
jgi:hypothetical protein